MSLKLDACAVMAGYVGVTEPHGNNDGDQINKAQRLLGLKEGTATTKGDPYCAAILMCAFSVALARKLGVDPTDEVQLKAVLNHNLKPLCPVSASVTALKLQAEQRGTWIPFKASYVAQRGDLICFDFGQGQRHVGIVDNDPADGKRLFTIEGNTTYEAGTNPETNDPKAGGIYRRTRLKTTGSIWGYIKMPV